MLEIRKTTVTLNEEELLELELIITDQDVKAALNFLKRSVYERIVRSQQGKLKSHLDGTSDPATNFK